MKKERLPFSSKVMLLWALMNIVMMPLAFAAPANYDTSKIIDTESISTTTFSKITPLGLEDDAAKTTFPDNGAATTKIFFSLMCFMMIACLGLSFKLKLSRKGQITVFIIIVLVLTVIFGFMFYLKNQTTGRAMEQEREKVFTDFMEASGFKNYMQSCLDKTSADAIQLIGMQGGYLYSDYPNDNVTADYYKYYNNRPQISTTSSGSKDYFDGLIATYDSGWDLWVYTYFGENSIPFEQNGMRTTLKYSIKNNAIRPNSAPLQPYRNYTLPLRSPSSDSDLINAVGDPSDYLPWPCNQLSRYKDSGLIDYFSSRNVLYQCNPPVLTRLQSQIYQNYSIDMKIADFVYEHTIECFDEALSYSNTSSSKLFESMVGLDAFVDYGNRSTYAIIGEDDVTVLFEIPIEVTIREGTRYKKTIEFSSRQDVRLRSAYDLAEAIIGRESRDIYFALDYANLNSRLGKACGVFEKNDTDIMIRVRNQTCVRNGMYVDINRNNGGPLARDYCSEKPDEWDFNNPKPDLTTEIVNHCLSASVVKIIDNESIVNDQPFVFLFAVENRPPALNYIDRKVVNGGINSIYYDPIYDDYLKRFYIRAPNVPDVNYFYQTGKLNWPDDFDDNPISGKDYRKHIIKDRGEPIRIIPQAIDPDDPPSNTTDNNIIYTYEGWKSDEPINLSNGPLSYDLGPYNIPNSNGLYTTPYESGDLDATDTDSVVNVWETSNYYDGNYYDDIGLTSDDLESMKTLDPPYVFPNIGSHNFIHKDAIYTTTGADVGYHWVRVYARDKKEPDRLFDYQDILIQVVCISGNTPCCDGNLDFHYDSNKCDTYCPSTHSCTNKGCCNGSDCIYDKAEDPVRTCP